MKLSVMASLTGDQFEKKKNGPFNALNSDYEAAGSRSEVANP